MAKVKVTINAHKHWDTSTSENIYLGTYTYYSPMPVAQKLLELVDAYNKEQPQLKYKIAPKLIANDGPECVIQLKGKKQILLNLTNKFIIMYDFEGEFEVTVKWII